ncbi:odorant receptor 13a-like isoform X2 [Linepithema humile]|uniref:odorant receptor 13a-like isoform X2 n=1 Tax=Linepithema humile TaxID=83485 RepID=UPI00351DD086
MAILENNPQTHQKRATIDVLLLCYRAYTRRIRKLLYLGGVLHDRKRSAVWSYIMSFIVIFMCFACFLVKRKKLIELHETLNDLFEQELASDRENKNVLATLHAFDRPSYLLCFILGSTTLFYVCPSMIFIVRQIVQHSESKIYKLPIPVKLPWLAPINGGPVFYLLCLYQYFTCWWMIFTIGSVDSLFGFYAFQISAILRAMSIRLANPRPNEVFSKVLGTCVETHHRIERCGRMLEDVWGLIILRVIIANAILMCALIFEVSPFTDLTINQIFSFISYMALKLLQTFIYAWYGSLITSASEHFREGIYFSNWPDSKLDRHMRANIILAMMQKPLTIRALKVSHVNVNMFTNILNTAMSYFFLLQSLDEGG